MIKATDTYMKMGIRYHEQWLSDEEFTRKGCYVDNFIEVRGLIPSFLDKLKYLVDKFPKSKILQSIKRTYPEVSPLQKRAIRSYVKELKKRRK